MDPKVYKTKHEQTCGQKPIELAYSNCVDNVGWQQASRLWLPFTADDFHHMTIWFTTCSASSFEHGNRSFDSILSPWGSRWPSYFSIHGNSVRSKSNMGVKCLHQTRRCLDFLLVFAHILPSFLLNWIDLQVILYYSPGHPYVDENWNRGVWKLFDRFPFWLTWSYMV